MTLFSNPADFMAGVAAAEIRLAEADPVMEAVIARAGPCTLVPQWGWSPYEALVRAVSHQQLQGKAAEAILRRFIALFAPAAFPAPPEIEASEDAAFRAVGFSASKIAAIRAIAAASIAGTVPTRAEADTLSDAELIGRLIPIRGVGRWTVEMLLIFTLGRLDVFPLDDFGVKTGMRVAYGLDGLPAKRHMIEASEGWRPYRTIASWYLWRVAERTPRPPRKRPA
jgi:DNA-3-methyladenine glycosylase II